MSDQMRQAALRAELAQGARREERDAALKLYQSLPVGRERNAAREACNAACERYDRACDYAERLWGAL